MVVREQICERIEEKLRGRERVIFSFLPRSKPSRHVRRKRQRAIEKEKIPPSFFPVLARRCFFSCHDLERELRFHGIALHRRHWTSTLKKERVSDEAKKKRRRRRKKEKNCGGKRGGREKKTDFGLDELSRFFFLVSLANVFSIHAPSFQDLFPCSPLQRLASN